MKKSHTSSQSPSPPLVPPSSSLSACGGDAGASAEAAKGEISYWLWDANQLPGLPAVRRRLPQGQPGHHRQDHPARLGRLLEHPDHRLRRRHRPGRLHRPPGQVRRVRQNKQLLPLDDAVKKDNVDLTAYNEGLADLWVGQDGKRYGLPKDWDTDRAVLQQGDARRAPASPRTS